MKPLLFPAGVAVLLHGLVFCIEAEWIHREGPPRPLLKPISITLSYPQPQKKASRHEIRAKDVQMAPVPALQEEKRFEKEIQPTVTQEVVSLSNLASPPEGQRSTKAPEEPIDLLASSLIEDSHKPVKLKVERVAALQPFPSPLREAVPAYRRNLHPIYPRIARRKGYEGTVVLEVLVDDQGKVGDLRLFQSSGYPILDRAAMKSVTNWLFEPGQRGDKTVEMWVKVPVRFQLR